MRRRPLVPLLAAALAVVAVGCRDDVDPAPGPDAEAALEGELVVLAATSLAEGFEEVEAAFETIHPQVDVQLTTDGSANLATAIIEGAPGDVFASADETNLQRVSDEGLVHGEGTVFVTNRLQIVVTEGNPLGITELADLADPSVTVALCQAEVPCGAYAREAFARAGLSVPAAGEEDKVSGVLTKVMLGEADAGLVYVTDVLGAEGVDGVDLAPGQGVRARYPAAVLRDAGNPLAAAAFVTFLHTDGQDILLGHGFELP